MGRLTNVWRVKPFPANKSVSNMITRKIWMYWDQGWEQAPDLVTHCKNSWAELNPDFELYLLDKDTLFDYIDLPQTIDIKRKDLTIQKISALARLALLSKYGGVWVDGTTMCTQPLSEWLEEYYGCHFFAFRNPGKDRLMANWMIAAEPDSVILQRLHKDFTDFYANNFFSNMGTAHGEKMLRYLGRHWNKDSKSSIKWHHWLVRKVLRVYPYFIFHYTFNRLILQDSECAKLWHESKALPAEPPHRVQKLERKTNNIIKARNVIDSDATPVHKLNWRVDSSNRYWSNILPYFRQYNT